MKTFVDTNILVYAEDLDAGEKHDMAVRLVTELWESGEGVLSIQVLQELFVTLTRKLPRPVPAAKTRKIVEQYLTWTVVDNSGPLLLGAIDLASRSRIAFWDALIVHAAQQSGCGRLMTEDMSHGQKFGNVRVLSPFVQT